MKFNTSYYQEAISHTHHMLNNLSKSFSKEENSQQDYICIPSTKKGKISYDSIFTILLEQIIWFYF